MDEKLFIKSNRVYMSSSDMKYKILVMLNCRKETKGTVMRSEQKEKPK